MNILIACEFSGIVRDAFLARGHATLSCDLLPSEQPGPHYQGDVRDLLGMGWDLMVAFPPCTYLSAAGAHLWKMRKVEIQTAYQFFRMLYDAPIPCVALENPQGWVNTHFRKPDQTIHPWQFGEPFRKRTCLWLRNLSCLVPTKIVRPAYSWVDSTGYRGLYRDQKMRSRAFYGIAEAMADQWT